MNKNQSFQRKIFYGVCMIVLLIAISLISRPATSDEANPGGWLAQQRKQYRISDAELGKVDPASEAMRLSLLGLDGVAITILWNNLNEYQKTEQYTLMEATAKTISYLNPHLLKVWEFQAWNLSYNVSREFDNYKHRYLWVKRGINYHMQGTEYNYNEPRMMNSIAHFFGNKFGTADEKEQYRELFPDDDLFHNEIQAYLEGTAYSVENDAEGIIEGKPDNWLVARIWNRWATEVVDNGLGTIGGMSPTIFYQYPAKRLMNFGEAVENEGYINEKAQAAWAQAYDEWLEFGDHELPSTYGIPIKLNDSQRLAAEIEQQSAKFEEQFGQYRDAIYQQKFEKLPEETQQAINTPEAERTEEQISLVQASERSLQVSYRDIVNYMGETQTEGRVEAAKLAKTLEDAMFLKGVIDRQKSIVAFDYWLTRAASEKTDRTIEARKLIFEAREAYRDANLVQARELYEEAWDRWVAIYNDYPELRDDASSDDLADSIKQYRSLLNQFDLDISPNFPLIDLLRNNDDTFVEPAYAPGEESTEAATEQTASANEENTAENMPEAEKAADNATDETAPKTAAEPMQPESKEPTSPEPASPDTEPMTAEPSTVNPSADDQPATEAAAPEEDAPEEPVAETPDDEQTAEEASDTDEPAAP